MNALLGLTFELLKLVLQLSGAVIVARLTVSWALKRYKSEKTWERRMTAYIDALGAIGAMERISGRQFDRAIVGRDTSPEQDEIELEEWRSSRRRLNENIVSARLLFSEKTSVILTSVILADLDKAMFSAAQNDFYVESLDDTFGALRAAKEALIEDGRTTLKLD